MFAKEDLEAMYYDQHLSMMEIATILHCSPNKVTYWMDKYGIKRRSISDAIYHKNNPNGDPFAVQPVDTIEKAILYGMGIGLYWGEGNKRNHHSIRLGNTDPLLIKTFMKFLIELFGVKKEDFRFGLQIFTDIDERVALNYWIKELDVNEIQFTKVHVTISGSIGTYKEKSQYGVMTVHYHRKRLRDILGDIMPR